MSNVVLVPVASPQTVSAVHDYVKAWQNAEINIAKAKVKYENHERMTKAEKKWLHSYDKQMCIRDSITVGNGKNSGDPDAQYEVNVSRNAVKDAAREAVTVNNGDVYKRQAIVKPSLLTVVSPIFTEPSLVRSRSLDN